MLQEKKYNYCFDFIKGIACIFVVLMHCEVPGVAGVVIQSISRFCVPFFFMISGYYSYNTDEKCTLKRIKKNAVLTFGASLLYIFFAIFQSCMGLEISFHIGKRSLLVWLIFNEPFIIAGQMWFLFALIYVYILYYFIQKLHLEKIAYMLIPVLIIVYITLAQGMHVAGIFVPNFIYRNFLIEGFPFFMLGNLMHKKEETWKVDNKIILCIIALTTVMCIGERAILGRDFGVNICTFVQVTAIFMYGINNGERHSGRIQRIGKKYSMYVYILHPFIWHTLEMVYSGLNISHNIVAMYIMPLLVIILSLLLSALCYKIFRSKRKM